MFVLLAWGGGGRGGRGGEETGSQIVNLTAGCHKYQRWFLKYNVYISRAGVYISKWMGDCIIIVQNITQNNVHSSRVDLKFRGTGGNFYNSSRIWRSVLYVATVRLQ